MSVRERVCVACVSVCKHVRVVCVRAYLCVHVCVSRCASVCVSVCLYVREHVCVRVYLLL